MAQTSLVRRRTVNPNYGLFVFTTPIIFFTKQYITKQFFKSKHFDDKYNDAYYRKFLPGYLHQLNQF